MSLKDADMLVKLGDYAGALKAVQAEKQRHPGNKYADAYKERILALLRESATWPLDEIPRKAGISPAAPVGTEGMLSAEHRLQKIATPLMIPNAEDEKVAAIRGKVDALLSSAREALAQQKYDTALDAVRRAALLDPQHREIRVVEERVRAAQDETRSRAEREEKERSWEDRLRREQKLREEFDRIKAEREEKRQTEETKKRVAQEQKIQQSLARVRGFLSAGQVEEAQCELAFVSVLAPGASEVLALETELSRKQQEAEQARQEAERKTIEQARERAAFLRKEIGRCVEEAEELCRTERFDEALRVLTDAYLLDPNADAVESCEARILVARREWESRVETDRQAAEEAIRHAEAEARARREEEERLKFLEEEAAREVAEKLSAEREIGLHLAAARTALADRRYREALAEVALAYMIDPLSREVQMAEEEILREKNSMKESAPPPPQLPELSPEIEADLAASARFLAEAKRLAADHRYVAALFEAHKGLAIDPDNLTTRRLIASIKAEYEIYQEDQKRNGGSREGRGKSSGHLRRTTPEEKLRSADAVGLIRRDLEVHPPAAAPDETHPKQSWWGRVKEAWHEAAVEERMDWQRPTVDVPLPTPPPSPQRPPSSAMSSTIVRLP